MYHRVLIFQHFHPRSAHSNCLASPIKQHQQKKCNPALTKTFKERNPDLDIDEIQANPNIPDDVKAELRGTALDTGFFDSELTDAVTVSGTSVEQLIFDKYDDLFTEESDEERRRRSRRSKKHEDDEWFATKRERLEKQRKDTNNTPGGKLPRGRPKRKSLESDSASAQKVKRAGGKKKGTEESGSDSMSSPSDSSSASKMTPRKQPPVLPFSLLDLSKKFEGKIPNLKTAARSQEVINVKTASASSQSIAAMLSAGPGKHERKQDKTNIWRNNSSSIPAPPSMMNYMKPAITYPPTRQQVEEKAAVLNSIMSGQYFEANGNGAGIGGGGGGGDAGGTSRPSNYDSKLVR